MHPQATRNLQSPSALPTGTLDSRFILYFRTVHGVGASNTFAVYGNGVDKELTELVPGILSQLGPDSLASLRKLAESYQAMNAAHMASQQGAGKDAANDEVPDVVR